MRFVAQPTQHPGLWWVLDTRKGKYGRVTDSGLTEAEARAKADERNGVKT